MITAQEVVPEPTCRGCGQDAKHCGPLVKGEQYGEDYIGLRHLPNLGERRQWRSEV